MKQNYTHFTVILDQTGSMETIRDDMIGGFNAFLEKQKAEPGTATLTLVQFDSQDPYDIIHRFKPIEDVPKLTRKTYVPRASTPLLDALGRGIKDHEKIIKEKTEQNDWQFVFVSADLAAIGDAMEVGIHPDAVLLFEKSGIGSMKVWAALSDSTADFRSARKKKNGFQPDESQNTDEPERQK